MAGKGPIAKFLPPRSAAGADRQGQALGRRRGVLRLRQGGQGRQARGRGAHPDRQRPRNLQDRRLRVLLDRRLPDVRVERGGEADRLLPQPLLHAAGRPRGAREGGSADDQGVPVRHRLQRRRTVVGGDPQPSPRRDEKGVRHRRLRRGRALGEVRRHVPRLPVRRAAARRHRARRRPDRDAAGGRGEPARSRALPDEPAGRGPDDGRPGRGHPEGSCASCTSG